VGLGADGINDGSIIHSDSGMDCLGSWHALSMPRSGPSTPPPPFRPRTMGERIRTLRMQWGWTQEQLGSALNTDQTAVSAWERDKARPSGAALSAIARLAGLSVEVLDSDAPICVNQLQSPSHVAPRTHPDPQGSRNWHRHALHGFEDRKPATPAGFSGSHAQAYRSNETGASHLDRGGIGLSR
jgi:transcriptional regulator with XRE-family HTH domain